jgi:hypothetical protein
MSQYRMSLSADLPVGISYAGVTPNLQISHRINLGSHKSCVYSDGEVDSGFKVKEYSEFLARSAQCISSWFMHARLAWQSGEIQSDKPLWRVPSAKEMPLYPKSPTTFLEQSTALNTKLCFFFTFLSLHVRPSWQIPKTESWEKRKRILPASLVVNQSSNPLPRRLKMIRPKSPQSCEFTTEAVTPRSPQTLPSFAIHTSAIQQLGKYAQRNDPLPFDPRY